MSNPFALAQYTYDLPEVRIAQHPAEPRDASRLLVMPRGDGPWLHRRFTDLPEFLRAGDLLIVNRTEVIPAPLQLRRPSGGRVELLLHRPLTEDIRQARAWEGLGRPGGALQPGKRLLADDGTELEIIARH